MAEERSGAWLQRTLMRVCCGEGARGIQLDPDTVASLVSYCELATPADAVEYLVNIVGQESCMEVAEEYFRRRSMPPQTIVKPETGAVLQAYQKSQPVDSAWSSGSKNTKASKQKRNGGEGSSSSASFTTSPNVAPPSSSASPTAAASSSPAVGTKKSSGRGKKGTKAVTLAEASKMMEFPQGKPCDCQATRHKLVNNCLSCGKIVCQQEGEGPCNFCGALVLKEGSTYAGLESNMKELPTTDAEAAAQAFKDRLVEYDRNSASRTTVIDDQSDFFDHEGDAWVTEEEKQLLRKKQEELERAEEERKKRVVVTIDLLGRKVVMAGGAEGPSTESIFLKSDAGPKELERTKSFRVKASPDVRELPVYVNTGPQIRDKTNVSDTKKMAISGRVQYEDSFSEALLGRKMELLQIDHADRNWEKPRLMQASATFEEAAQSFECA